MIPVFGGFRVLIGIVSILCAAFLAYQAYDSGIFTTFIHTPGLDRNCRYGTCSLLPDRWSCGINYSSQEQRAGIYCTLYFLSWRSRRRILYPGFCHDCTDSALCVCFVWSISALCTWLCQMRRPLLLPGTLFHRCSCGCSRCLLCGSVCGSAEFGKFR